MKEHVVTEKKEKCQRQQNGTEFGVEEVVSQVQHS